MLFFWKEVQWILLKIFKYTATPWKYAYTNSDFNVNI